MILEEDSGSLGCYLDGYYTTSNSIMVHILYTSYVLCGDE